MKIKKVLVGILVIIIIINSIIIFGGSNKVTAVRNIYSELQSKQQILLI
jgi:hypothetical protein